MSGPCRTGSPGGGASPTRPRVRRPDLLLTRAEPPSRPPPGGGHARHPALVLEGRHLGVATLLLLCIVWLRVDKAFEGPHVFRVTHDHSLVLADLLAILV